MGVIVETISARSLALTSKPRPLAAHLPGAPDHPGTSSPRASASRTPALRGRASVAIRSGSLTLAVRKRAAVRSWPGRLLRGVAAVNRHDLAVDHGREVAGEERHHA